MLEINLKKFDTDYLRETRHLEYEKGWDFHLQMHIIEAPVPLCIKINNKTITVPEESGYMIGDTLEAINNGFYLMLLEGKARIVFNRPDILHIQVKGNKILFTNEKLRRPDLQAQLHDEPSDLIQAVEEVIRAVNEYRSICLEAARELKPNDVDEFMFTMMPGPRWKDLESTWDKYKQDNNIT